MSAPVLAGKRAVAVPAKRVVEKAPSSGPRADAFAPDRDDNRATEDRAVSGTQRPEWSFAGMSINPSDRRGGDPLDAATRALFERRFGTGFGAVRVHTDDIAAQVAHSVRAAAIASGSEIWFGAGAYRPRTARGQQLLAHELAHVLQHKHGGAGCGSRWLSDTRDAAEQQAEAMSESFARGEALAGWSAVAPSSLWNLAPETWYRGEAQGVGQAKDAAAGVRGVKHDLGDGTYFTDKLDVAREFADLRSGGDPATTTVLEGEVDPQSLGKVLDLTAEPKFMELYGQVTKTMPKLSGEPYRNLVDGYLNSKGQKLTDFDVVIGPEGVRGGKQMAIRDPQLVLKVRSVMKPVTPGGSGGSGTSGGGPSGGGAAGEASKTPSRGGSAVEEGSATTPKAEVTTPEVVPDTAGATGEALDVAPKPPARGGGVGEVVAEGGLAGEIGGIVLSVAAELVITVAISLIINWLIGKIEEAIIESDTRKLDPQIEDKLKGLGTQITEAQKKGKVYARITIDVVFRDGIASSPEAAQAGVPAVPYRVYGGTSLVSVEIASEDKGTAREEKTEPSVGGESKTHYLQSFSALIDDPKKRAREKQNAALREHLNKVVPKQKAQAEPPPQNPQPQPQLLPTPAPPQQTQEFNPLPGAPGPSPLREAEQVVADFKAKALALKARGEALLSKSGTTSAEIAAFTHDEDIWRSVATLWLNHYTDKGPDTGRSGMDEVLNSDQYGGRLKQIRQSLGG